MTVQDTMVGAARVAVQVTDDGRWRPPPAERGHRGRGLDLIREIGDDVQLEHDAGGTRIRFTVPARPGPPRTPAEEPAADPIAPVAPTGPTRLRTVRTPDSERITVLGDLDPVGAASVGPALLTAARSDGADLEIDLRATTYLSSAGVALLADVADAARTARRRVQLTVRPAGVVGRALTLGGVDRLFEPADDRL